MFDFFRSADDLRNIGSFAERADDLVMVAVSDQDQRIALLRKLDCFNVNFCDEWTCGIDDLEITGLAIVANFGRDSVCAVDHALARGNLINGIDKDRALGLEIFNHVAIVDDLLTDVDRGAKSVQGDLNDVNGADDSGAKSARLEQ